MIIITLLLPLGHIPFKMNTNASPGPDGFGLGFYRKYWPFLKPKILRLFQQFYSQSLDT
jgi:hypothetical protein